MKAYLECLVWTRLLFADLNSSPKILKPLLLSWPGYLWSAVVLNHAADSGREGTSIPALARLRPVGSGANHVMVSWVITFTAAYLACQHWCHCPLAVCPSIKRPMTAADAQILVGSTDFIKNRLIERDTSAKFRLYFFHLSFSWKSN